MEKESSKPMTKINNSSLRLLLRQQQMISTVLTSLSMRSNAQNTLGKCLIFFFTLIL